MSHLSFFLGGFGAGAFTMAMLLGRRLCRDCLAIEAAEERRSNEGA